MSEKRLGRVFKPSVIDYDARVSNDKIISVECLLLHISPHSQFRVHYSKIKKGRTELVERWKEHAENTDKVAALF